MIYDCKNPLQAAQLLTRAQQLASAQKIVELTEKKKRRSINQNSYLHLILGYFASQYGCDLEYAKKNYFKILCNKEIFFKNIHDEFLGDITVLRSSSELDTGEMTTAIDRFRNWSSMTAGIYLPEANEQEQMVYAEQEVERNKEYI
jgi:hypothetical protein